MLWAVWALPGRTTHSSISVRHTVLTHSSIISETHTLHAQLHRKHVGPLSGRRTVYKRRQPHRSLWVLWWERERERVSWVYLEATIHFLMITTEWINYRRGSAAPIQPLPSPIAVCWELHPPTTSVDRLLLWLLSLFGLSNQGEEKSSCYIHAAVPTALCPYVRPSAWLSVCKPELRPHRIWIQNKKKELNESSKDVGGADFPNLSVVWLSQAGRQAGLELLCLQAAFLLLCPLEPVTLWTGAQEKAGGVGRGEERWGSLVPGVQSLCSEEESEAPKLCSRSDSQGGS